MSYAHCSCCWHACACACGDTCAHDRATFIPSSRISHVHAMYMLLGCHDFCVSACPPPCVGALLIAVVTVAHKCHTGHNPAHPFPSPLIRSAMQPASNLHACIPFPIFACMPCLLSSLSCMAVQADLVWFGGRKEEREGEEDGGTEQSSLDHNWACSGLRIRVQD